VCAVDVGSCGACSTNQDCAPFQNTICNSTSGSCEACTAHAQCDSQVCFPDGTCGTDDNVAYVAPSGVDDQSCNHATPCKTVTAALATGKPNVKLTGLLDESVTITDRIVDIYADAGTRLSTSDNVAVIAIRNSTVTISDLTIEHGLFGIDAEVDNGKVGSLTMDHVSVLNASNVGLTFTSPVVVTGSVFAGNLAGGIKSQGATSFVFQNNIIVANGNASDNNDTTGGMNLFFSGPGPYDIEFNTFADNVAGPGFPKQTALLCGTLAQPPMTIENNIFSNNTVSLGTGITVCVEDYNLFDNGTAVAGAHDRTGLATFKNKNIADPTASDFYRTIAGSAAVDGGDAATKVTTDIDGVSRPQGAGFDMGASEVKPWPKRQTPRTSEALEPTRARGYGNSDE